MSIVHHVTKIVILLQLCLKVCAPLLTFHVFHNNSNSVGAVKAKLCLYEVYTLLSNPECYFGSFPFRRLSHWSEHVFHGVHKFAHPNDFKLQRSLFPVHNTRNHSPALRWYVLIILWSIIYFMKLLQKEHKKILFINFVGYVISHV